MKIARVLLDDAPRTAVVDGDDVHVLAPEIDVATLLDCAPDERDDVVDRHMSGAPLQLDAIQLLSPVEPPTLRDFLTFPEHLEGSLALLGLSEPPASWFEQPLFYFSNTSNVIGPDAAVEVPPGCRRLDFELELAAVVGRAGRNIAVEDAGAHIAGYTIFNDWSARDVMEQVVSFGMGPVHGKDFANTLGPWIVTSDELERYRRGDRLALDMHAELNGAPLPAGGDSSAHMSWSFEELVAYASRGADLRTGDVLASGTCGAGCLLEYWAHGGDAVIPSLQPGDEVTLVVEGIGSVRNTIVPGVDPQPVPRARTGLHRTDRAWPGAAS